MHCTGCLKKSEFYRIEHFQICHKYHKYFFPAGSRISKSSIGKTHFFRHPVDQEDAILLTYRRGEGQHWGWVGPPLHRLEVFIWKKWEFSRKKLFSTCDSPGQVPAASHPDSAPPSTTLQDLVVTEDVGVPNPHPQASETGNLTRTEDDHDDGDEDLDDFDDREIVKAHRGWIKMTLSVQENPFLIPVSSVRMHSFSWENGYCLILG